VTARLQIRDGTGSGAVAQVSSNSLLVQQLPETSVGIPAERLSNLRQLREFFVDSSGSSAQNVDGSVTPVEFSISAEPDKTRWVAGFRLILEGASLALSSNDFRRYGAATGASTPLTNGVEIETFQGGTTVPVTVDPVVILGDYLEYADNDFVNFVNAIATGVDFMSFTFTFTRPVCLTSGSKDSLIIRINDDLTAIDKQVAIARGYQEVL